MAGNKITNKLSFKMYRDWEVIKKIDRVFTCEEQDIKLIDFLTIPNGNGTYHISLIIEINKEPLILKKHISDISIINRFDIGDDRTSDKAQLEMIIDIIGFNAFRICYMIARQFRLQF